MNPAGVGGDGWRRLGSVAGPVGWREQWTWIWRLAAYATLLVLALLTFQALLVALDPASIGELTLWGVGAAVAAALVAGWVMMSRVESRPPAALGLVVNRRAARDFSLGCGIGAGLLGSVVLVMAIAGWLNVTGIGVSSDVIARGMPYVTVLLVLAAFFEELAIRGYPFQLLAGAHGPGVAVGGTAVVFAVLHGANPGVGWGAMGNTLLAGILLGVLYWRTLSLWLVTGTHFAWNWTMGVAAGLPVSGLDVGPALVDVSVSGPDLWTGGAYGPEGGLLLTMATIAGIAWTARTARLSRDPAVLALGPLIGGEVERENPVSGSEIAPRIGSEG